MVRLLSIRPGVPKAKGINRSGCVFITHLIITDGKNALPKFLNVFNTLGIDQTRITLIVPDSPIFHSPSPHIVKDIQILTGLFDADV